MKLTWLLPPPYDPLIGLVAWTSRSIASDDIYYYVYDNADGTFRATVIQTRGTGTLNNEVAQEAASLEAAQVACEDDWELHQPT